MKVKKYLGTALAIGLAICLSGCGEKFPELTDQQYAQTVEYAAGLLMKHSNNGQERLVHVDAKEVEKQRAKEAEAAEKAAEEEAQKQKEQKKPATKPEPTPAAAADGSKEELGEDGQPLTTGDTPVTGDSSEAQAEGEDTGAETGGDTDITGAITLSDEETQEIADDIFLSYQGYMVSSSYPESSKSYVVNADKGKKLLVLRFDLYNGSDGSKNVNLISLNPQFEIIMNGKNLGYSAVTFLPNDLSTYSGTIESRAHESVVVLTQISTEDSKNIQSLGMIATMKGQSQTVNLK